MQLRRLLAIGVLVLMGGILAACGSEEDEADPTPEPTTSITSDEEDVTEPTPTDEVAATDEAEEEDASTSVASPVASPVSAIATADVVVSPATPVASTPVTEEGTPVGDADEESTPDTEAVVPVMDAEEESTPEATEVPMTSISGTLMLDGRVQQDFTLSEEGCVGLGEWRQLEPGTQVIVRDASGTVVDVSALEGHDSGDVCAWNFEVDVPSADYFSISIPMVTEVWFDQNDPAVESGELELFVP